MKLLICFVTLTLFLQSVGQTKIEMSDLKINQQLSQAEEIRSFYKNVLGAQIITPESKIPRDYIQFSNNLRLNLIYIEDENNVPSVDDFDKGLWIKIYVDEFEERSKKIKNSGVKIVREVPEKNELYFQAPGGQIFRMVESTN